MYLHGNKIAEIGDTWMCIFDGGWQSNTTKSRLNALLSAHGLGGDDELMIHWISTYNNHLKFCPGDYLTDARMNDTIRYLEGMVYH